MLKKMDGRLGGQFRQAQSQFLPGVQIQRPVEVLMLTLRADSYHWRLSFGKPDARQTGLEIQTQFIHCHNPALGLRLAELAADKTFQDRGIRQTMHHPKAGDYVMSGWPVRFGGKTPALKSAPLIIPAGV